MIERCKCISQNCKIFDLWLCKGGGSRFWLVIFNYFSLYQLKIMSINKFSPNTEKYGPEKIRVVFFSSSVRPYLLNTLLSNPKYLTSFSFEKCFDHVPQEISFKSDNVFWSLLKTRKVNLKFLKALFCKLFLNLFLNSLSKM